MEKTKNHGRLKVLGVLFLTGIVFIANLALPLAKSGSFADYSNRYAVIMLLLFTILGIAFTIHCRRFDKRHFIVGAALAGTVFLVYLYESFNPGDLILAVATFFDYYGAALYLDRKLTGLRFARKQ